MTRIFDASKEKIKPCKIPTPYKQKDGYKKDGTPRKPKWKIKAQQGCIPANEYVWWYYYGEHEKDMIPIFLDDNPLNTSKENIALISKVGLKTLVSNYTNYYVNGNKSIRQMALDIINAELKLKQLEKEVNESERN